MSRPIAASSRIEIEHELRKRQTSPGGTRSTQARFDTNLGGHSRPSVLSTYRHGFFRVAVPGGRGAHAVATALAPANLARSPSSSSIRSSWLYLATRSERAGAPVLICPTPVATARSAMNVSSVSPERCEIDGAVAGVARDRDRVERLGERPDLVELDQDRVRDAALDPLAQDRRVGDEDVVADELKPARRAARSARASRPSRPRPSRPRGTAPGSGRGSPPSSRPSRPRTATAPRRRARSGRP